MANVRAFRYFRHYRMFNQCRPRMNKWLGYLWIFQHPLNSGLSMSQLAIYFQEVGDTSTSGASTHQVAFEIARQLRLCSCFVLSLCARVVIISCFPQYTSKRVDSLVDRCMIVCGHTSELELGSRK